MSTFFRVAAIFFALGIIGNFLNGQFSPIVIVVTAVCAYFGWKHKFKSDKEKKETEKFKQEQVKEIVKTIIEMERITLEAKKPMSERFNEAQKHALICCLYVVIAADDEVVEAELRYIEQVVKALNYEAFDEERIVHNVLHNREMIIDVVKNFNSYQQKKLISLMEGAINADWQVKEIELMYADSILQQAGILNDRFLEMGKRLNKK